VTPGDETQVQRAQAPERISPASRRRGFEDRDADPRKVIYGILSVVVLLVSGIVAGALTLSWLGAEAPTHPEALAGRVATMPPPHLLLDQPPVRANMEAEARSHLPEAALARARRTVIAAGWGNAGKPQP